MNAADVFLSLDGRLDRERWLGGVALLVLMIAATHAATWQAAAHGLMDGRTRDMARAFVQAFALAPWAALDWKRFHDIGRPGSLALVCPGLYAASRIWDAPALAALAPGHAAVAAALSWTQVLVSVWLAYALACLAGSPGPNAYGPPPRPFKVAP